MMVVVGWLLHIACISLHHPAIFLLCSSPSLPRGVGAHQGQSPISHVFRYRSGMFSLLSHLGLVFVRFRLGETCQ